MEQTAEQVFGPKNLYTVDINQLWETQQVPGQNDCLIANTDHENPIEKNQVLQQDFKGSIEPTMTETQSRKTETQSSFEDRLTGPASNPSHVSQVLSEGNFVSRPSEINLSVQVQQSQRLKEYRKTETKAKKEVDLEMIHNMTLEELELEHIAFGDTKLGMSFPEAFEDGPTSSSAGTRSPTSQPIASLSST